ncbi:hypothetical protein BKA70DRAFT_51742 [Coprinopsis sp. MPI-PUGE-AT-0042]|nr:hypothetical protein BKA70DRAFT_51742 [Coprinopsis sp. MPI-PUGE-AT-0042]
MGPAQEESYNLLRSGDDEDDFPQAGRQTKATGFPETAVKPTLLVLAVFFALDISIYFYIAKDLAGVALLPNHSQLEFRNPYYGLDSMYSLTNVTHSRYPKLQNMPRFTSQIDVKNPNHVSQIDPHRWLSPYGILSPPDRRLEVSEMVHTVMQFHVLDYGMEKCAFAVRLPARDAMLPHPHSFSNPDVISLDICELEGRRPLDEHKISWNARPKCSKHVATLDARVGEEVELPSFPCKSGDLVAYEVACAPQDPQCQVDVWSNQNDTWGMFMYQYQTV